MCKDDKGSNQDCRPQNRGGQALDYRINFKKALIRDLERKKERIRSEITNLNSKKE